LIYRCINISAYYPQWVSSYFTWVQAHYIGFLLWYCLMSKCSVVGSVEETPTVVQLLLTDPFSSPFSVQSTIFFSFSLSLCAWVRSKDMKMFTHQSVLCSLNSHLFQDIQFQEGGGWNIEYKSCKTHCNFHVTFGVLSIIKSNILMRYMIGRVTSQNSQWESPPPTHTHIHQTLWYILVFFHLLRFK